MELIKKREEEGYEEVLHLRKEEMKVKKTEYHAIRKEEKGKKRGINVEICSELVDLILDIGDEAF